MDDKQSTLFSIENNFAILDELMGSKWDVYSVNHSAPEDHFTFIRSIGINVNSLKTTFVLPKGRSIYPFSMNYREIAVALMRSANAVALLRSTSAVLSLSTASYSLLRSLLLCWEGNSDEITYCVFVDSTSQCISVVCMVCTS